MASNAAPLGPEVVPESNDVITLPNRSVGKRLTKFLYNHSPFYLLSVSCVLHGTAHWLRVEGAIAAPPDALVATKSTGHL